MNTIDKPVNKMNEPDPAPEPQPGKKEPGRNIPVSPDEDNDPTVPVKPIREPESEERKKAPAHNGPDRKDAPQQEGNFNDPTTKGDPGRIVPGKDNAALSGKVSSWFFVLLICLSLTLPQAVKADEVTAPAKTEISAEAQVLINRLEEIKAMDKSELTTAERRSLRKEVRDIREQLRELSGGVYLSVGAIIIIILLLILLL